MDTGGTNFQRCCEENWGERVYDVRTTSNEVWDVFLREFKRWGASEEGHELVKHLQMLK